MTRKPIDITDFIEDEPEVPRKRQSAETRKSDPLPFPDATPREKAIDARKAKRGSFLWWVIFIVFLIIVFGD